MKALSGEGLDPSDLQASVVRLHEQTDQFRLEVWSQWCPFVWPFGWLISALFSRRIGPFATPLRPLDTAKGIDSRVLGVRNDAGKQIGAAWLRKLRSTGQTVYSGWYGTAQLPESDQPSVRVVFPLCEMVANVAVQHRWPTQYHEHRVEEALAPLEKVA
jgi:hypothetical protein